MEAAFGDTAWQYAVRVMKTSAFGPVIPFPEKSS